MRLARFCGELGFRAYEKTLLGAKQNCDKIIDISKERIFAELQKILVADKKHSFSPQNGHYLGLKVLDEIGVLKIILPDLSAGKGLKQRKDFHDYDVLEHSLRAVLYAREDVRLSALLHDVGKPYAFNKDGNFYQHPTYGEKMVTKILNGLKAPKKIVEEVAFLTKFHMLDLDLSMSEMKIRKFIVNNYKHIDKLLALKHADFSACKDNLSICETINKWRKIFDKMLADGTPFSIKDLKITAKELMDVGIKGKRIGELQKKMLEECVIDPSLNNKEKLLKIALNSVK
jgi:tRNA nucleotidyltransferase (CCA-adding enzyme)